MPTQAQIKKAAQLLTAGQLVAFPTETVYGLGANALDARAVAKIFVAKGRPSDNPLIVHIAGLRDLEMVARNIPRVARVLMKKFWPGPLTFVLKKRAAVPAVVTAGGTTVAVRMPANKIALALIKAAGCPVAAPSANLAGRPSPTTAKHVVEDFGDEIQAGAVMILDGGKTLHGLESTVIDVTRADLPGGKVEILRSGAVTAEMLAKVLGYKPKTVTDDRPGGRPHEAQVRSPGMKYKHYAPSVPLYLIGETDPQKMVQVLQKNLQKFSGKKMRVGVLCVRANSKKYRSLKWGAAKIVTCGSRKTFGRELYAALRKFSKKDVDLILAENCGSKGIGAAVFDRLKRAATKVI